METENKVVIIIEGGNIQKVYASDADIEVVIIDYDNAECNNDEAIYRLAENRASLDLQSVW